MDDALAQTGKMCERWGRWVEGFLYIVGFGVPSDYPGGSVLPRVQVTATPVGTPQWPRQLARHYFASSRHSRGSARC